MRPPPAVTVEAASVDVFTSANGDTKGQAWATANSARVTTTTAPRLS